MRLEEGDIVVEAKGPKPLTPCPVSSDRTNAERKADQLGTLRQGQPFDESVRPLDWPEGVGEKN